MARVTVEDCIEIIPNRFELVVAAAQRAKQISSGAPLTVDRDNDKDSVVALREIAERSVHSEKLMEEIVNNFCRRHAPEQFEAAPFGDEMNDEMARLGEIRQEFNESQRLVDQTDEIENADGMSFAEENVDPED
ncbi:MAG: DNA-directed RNA polymerase subunit omega [Rickettsiales bacterium]|nr:DNA-directed RNA polymerase subunit omega [Rickettsiales bacterium]